MLLHTPKLLHAKAVVYTDDHRRFYAKVSNIDAFMQTRF